MGHAADFRGISLIHEKAVLSSLLPGMSTIEDIYWAGTVYGQCILCRAYLACVTSPSFLYKANTKRKGTLWQALLEERPLSESSPLDLGLQHLAQYSSESFSRED